jgi:hypothetical protein
MGDFTKAIAYQKQALSMIGENEKDRLDLESRVEMRRRMVAVKHADDNPLEPA